MTTKLTLLGTGNALVTKCYNTCFALTSPNGCFLTDAGGGNGILTQLEKASIAIPQIRWMFVTHGHTDHILGVIWIIRLAASLSLRGQHNGLTIFCHDECEEKLRTFCRMTLTKKLLGALDNTVRFVRLQDGQNFTAGDFNCTAFDIHSTKMKQFGYRAQLPDGKTLVCLGDEPFNPLCRAYAQGADLLMSEAFCLYTEKDLFNPYEKHHSTAKDAARVAAELQAKSLLLYHTQDNNLPQRKELYTQEARQEFAGPIYVPDDLETLVL